MSSTFVARVRRKLKASPNLLKTTKAIRADRLIRAGDRILWQQVLRRSDVRILESFPIFTPVVAGSIRSRAVFTIQAANQTFPLILDLLACTGRRIEDPISIESLVDSDDKRLAAKELRSLFDRYGSDKATTHNYHLLYGAILAERDSIIALLEVGLGTNNLDVLSNMGIDGKPGASLRAFRDFLPKARIYGADVDRRILFSEERISTFFVDQTDPGSFVGVADAVDGGFDLIIDDGLHSPHANLATLLFALERLKIGGWFVVEDIAASALPVWQVVALMPDYYNSYIVASKAAFLFVVHGRHNAWTAHRPGTRADRDLAIKVWQRRAVLTNFLIDQPVCTSIHLLTARAANTTVRWAPMECSRHRAPGWPGRVGRAPRRPQTPAAATSPTHTPTSVARRSGTRPARPRPPPEPAGCRAC